MKNYQTLREIGRGGFGVVEEVRNPDGELFARKTFKPSPHVQLHFHDKLRRRFRREVMIQTELGGQEIMPILSQDLDGDAPWFVMPLAEKTYEDQISDDRRMGSVDIDAVADILNGLELLHDLGFVHRDLNPKNILLHDSRWKLSDLGAVLPPSGHTVTLTEDTVIYTERYCAPEQRNDFHNAQPAADVFAFGCILHDIFGKQPRIPYSQQTAEGPIGLLIQKCTEVNPARRPSIKVLRGMLLENLVEIGGHCKVEDHQSEVWLARLASIEEWTDSDYDEFARFFAQLDIGERVQGHENDWVYTLSTPFLTRLSSVALEKIVTRQDGVASAIIEKYCDWVRRTNFLFHYADTVCGCLTTIFDSGGPAMKALALIALIELGESHNRWYVMRRMLHRCSADVLAQEIARRLVIEIKTEEMESKFKRCLDEVGWDLAKLSPEFKKLR